MRSRWPLALLPLALTGMVVGTTAWRLGEAREGRRLLSTAQTLALDAASIRLPARELDMVLSPDGLTAYAKTTDGVAKVDLASGKVVAQVELKGGASMCGIDVGAAGVAVTDATESLVILDPASLAVRRTVDLGKAAVGGLCYPCGVRLAGDTAYIALNRGNALAIVDLGTGAFRTVPVGAAYVACANADTIVRAGFDGGMRETRLGGLPGAAPSSLALDGDRLWVALSGENRALAMDLASGKSLGSVETGWYPVAVRRGPRRGPRGLVVADAKGEGTPTRSVGQMVGAVRQIDPLRLRPTPKPVAERRRRLPIHHVVYIIKENRTYDQVFGDLPQGKGDPSLTMYGREVTPNHHALAEEFVLLDNFADNGSVSTDGHAWAIEGQSTTFYERSFGGWTRAYPFGGDEPLAISEGGHLWDATLAAGRSFRNYGEFMYANGGASFTKNYATWKAGGTIAFTPAIGVPKVRAYTCMPFPGWNLDIPDGYRADVFLREFREMERMGKMPDLVTMYLPQDHTSGDRPGEATPRAHVADNDLAVGRIVEALSHSAFWKDTAVFVLEDDPQDGLDSVDGHRSLCLVASPYTRRRAVVSAFYNQTSVLHTICDILVAKPYTRFIAASSSMADLFGDRADLTPYTARPETVPLDALNPPKKKATKLNLSGPDATNDETMDRVLWSMAFPKRPYPHDER